MCAAIRCRSSRGCAPSPRGSTLAPRSREIGVRVALGASRRRVVADIFRRPLLQVVLGVAAGTILIAVAIFALRGRPDGRIVGETGLSVEQARMVSLVETAEKAFTPTSMSPQEAERLANALDRALDDDE